MTNLAEKLNSYYTNKYDPKYKKILVKVILTTILFGLNSCKNNSNDIRKGEWQNLGPVHVCNVYGGTGLDGKHDLNNFENYYKPNHPVEYSYDYEDKDYVDQFKERCEIAKTFEEFFSKSRNCAQVVNSIGNLYAKGNSGYLSFEVRVGDNSYPVYPGDYFIYCNEHYNAKIVKDGINLYFNLP